MTADEWAEEALKISPEQQAEEQRRHNEWLAWHDRAHLRFKQLVDSEQHYHIQDIWIECLGFQKWLDCGGWDRIGSYLTCAHLMVREAPTAVFAEIGYICLMYRRDVNDEKWGMERFLRYVWRQTKVMEANPQLGHPDMFWRNRLIGLQEWAAKKDQPPPRPESFGTWS